MKVAVVIVSFHSGEDVRRCLSALAASTYSDFNVVICENGGPQAATALRAEVPSQLTAGQAVQVIDSGGNVGFAGGVNIGLAAVEADAYWILNPDTVPEPGALAALVRELKRAGGDGAVGHDIVLPSGKLANRGGGHWKSWSARAVSLDHGQPRDPQPDPAETLSRMNYLVGASILASASFVKRVGPLQEDYFLFCEEIEWCVRGQRLGERLLYAPDAVVLHLHGTTIGGGGPLRTRSKLAVYLQERNRLNLTRDLYPRRLPITAMLALVHLSVRHIKGAAFAQLGYALEGWAAGLRNERGKPGWMSAA